MRILRLEAENIKRLRAVAIAPTGNVVQITGKNGQGKTSVLDSLWWALAGQAAIQGEPIRQGESRARIRLDLGEIVVTRTFKRQDDGEITTAITVENAEGVRYGSPQRMLDALLGELSFDPLAFARASAKEQYELLRRFVPGVDFDAIEAANKADFDRRTALNRQAKEARAQAEGIRVAPGAPVAFVDEGAILAEITAASAHNSAVARLEDRQAAQAAAIQTKRQQLASLTAELQTLEAAPPIEVPAPIDVESLRTKYVAVQAANANARDRQRQLQLLGRAEDLERDAGDLTRRMQQREADKRAAIAAAAMPVPDLDFGEGVVLKAGVPFDQASDAEKLRASVAIAMALNPKLRVIRIRDGSLLDSASLALVSEMATERDCQVWIERVADDRKVGFVIEDGAVVAQDPDDNPACDCPHAPAAHLSTCFMYRQPEVSRA